MKHIILLTIISACCVISTAYATKSISESPSIDVDPPISAAPQRNLRGTDPLLKQQWNMTKIGMQNVWPNHNGSRTIKIMLIGTGVNYNHPDLRANIAVNRLEYNPANARNGLIANGKDEDRNGLIDDFIGYDYVDEDGLAYDHYGYDTYAAGIIGGVHNNSVGIKGILKYVSIYPVRYIDSSGMSDVPNLIQALKHILITEPHVVLLNLLNIRLAAPWGVRDAETTMIRDTLTKIQQKGIPIVVGAGNNPSNPMQDSEDSVIPIIRGFPNVFVVSNINKNDDKALLARHSSTWVHTMAPGQEIITTAPFGGWEKTSGTMMAAAHVAATLALGFSLFETTYADMFKVLLSSEGSDKFEEKFKDFCVGHNRLNVKKFLQVAALPPGEDF